VHGRVPDFAIVVGLDDRLVCICGASKVLGNACKELALVFVQIRNDACHSALRSTMSIHCGKCLKYCKNKKEPMDTRGSGHRQTSKEEEAKHHEITHTCSS